MWGVRQLAAGVWQVQAVASSVYVLAGRGRAIAVWDAGAIGSAGRVLSVVEHLGFSASHIQSVTLSHHHLDHSGGMARLIARTGATAAAHVLDVPAIATPPPALRQLGALSDLARAGWLFARARRVPIDLAVDEGDRLPGAEQFEIIHTPGHTAGSISLYDAERGLLIVGDALQHRWGVLSPPSRLFTADMPEAYRSIRKMATLDIQTLAFAHFPPITERAAERLRALAARLEGEAPTAARPTPGRSALD